MRRKFLNTLRTILTSRNLLSFAGGTLAGIYFPYSKEPRMRQVGLFEPNVIEWTYPHDAIEGKDRSNFTVDDYYMTMAFVCSARSKDPTTQVGAVIVDEKGNIKATGYNGLPEGIEDDSMPWVKDEGVKHKYFYVVHAEQNAILHKTQASSLKGCTIYTTMFPCSNCAQVIVDESIGRVVYFHAKEGSDFEISSEIFKRAGVILDRFKPRDTKLRIDLSPEEEYSNYGKTS